MQRILRYNGSNLKEEGVKICTRCIYDETVANIFFDSEGVCNYCHLIDQLKEEYGTGYEKGEQKFKEIVESKDIVEVLGVATTLNGKFVPGNKRPLFMELFLRGTFSMIKIIIDNFNNLNIDINQLSSLGHELLHLACRSETRGNNKELIKLLLKNKDKLKLNVNTLSNSSMGSRTPLAELDVWKRCWSSASYSEIEQLFIKNGGHL